MNYNHDNTVVMIILIIKGIFIVLQYHSKTLLTIIQYQQLTLILVITCISLFMTCATVLDCEIKLHDSVSFAVKICQEWRPGVSTKLLHIQDGSIKGV